MARHANLMIFFVYFQNIWIRAPGCHQCYHGCGASDCQDWYDLGHVTSGVYHVTPCGTRFGYDVYCDMETDGGGWTVFQRREDGSEDFYRNWKNYELGFGNITREFWLGLIPLQRILSQGKYELRVDLEDFNGQVRYAKYNAFNIGSSWSYYKLEATGYTGDAGNSLGSHTGYPFSTYDKDNDDKSTENCAQTHYGAWWFDSCRSSHLNGKYYCCGKIKDDGINWRKWERNGDVSNYSLKKTEMKIRRV